jgi:hypothetical protein
MQSHSTTSTRTPRTLAIGHKTPLDAGYSMATGHDGADAYLQAMWQDAQARGEAVNWSAIDSALAHSDNGR